MPDSPTQARLRESFPQVKFDSNQVDSFYIPRASLPRANDISAALKQVTRKVLEIAGVGYDAELDEIESTAIVHQMPGIAGCQGRQVDLVRAAQHDEDHLSITHISASIESETDDDVHVIVTWCCWIPNTESVRRSIASVLCPPS